MDPKSIPAYPCNDLMDQNGKVYRHPGMTLRDYFAAHATDDDVRRHLQDIKNEPHVVNDGGLRRVEHGRPVNAREIAKYLYADAMLKARQS